MDGRDVKQMRDKCDHCGKEGVLLNIICGVCDHGQCHCGAYDVATLVQCAICGYGHRYSKCSSDLCDSCISEVADELLIAAMESRSK